MSILRHDSHPIVEDAEGAYLTFDPSCRGTIVLTWSKKAIPDAFIYFNPRKPVPNFKYTGNGGRMQLSTNVQLDPPRYFQGICAFLKTLKQFDGELTVISQNQGPKPITVVLHVAGTNAVVKCERGVAYDLSKVDVVGVIPVDCSEFDCKTLSPVLFREKADRVGAGLTVL
ncbi:hypothetical protein TGPRC2_227030 [Toxoplasma gondii TgCatPRC2]|uniref:Immune mapped protein 2 N-terminal domain-containing protein n=15 Tax=Toxoplasma gondii TaxID=5811 RepID=A0A125YJ57_TOXGV|nr:hypothetical protein TGME49_227030 [Toxoplasma gondii ME49]EPR62319.1 hypothetical protein TGGT1_227030 [Toxoplasma gondii GT1]ESS32671.1 hypothetical protein TGVEG_227030 [Toxoplasma gondii VEG]KAF4640739.1 hypothetical protein TGRH88_046650 [Toxoplasma gondii]KFG42436.1 hypothetical protein TGP89_227030 [Toxoplasma gondii p89]KFG45177.1 hypothetical protein TGDOM2_227030 [Toxoplasma gondii GAB2-2007-GAL-DOM2]KFG51933.1 hypothetical protein TGFOU_227030 [Toxoplasma gondii FOU]KFG60978.1 |eukprot:XP_002366356.1 hypothetical protein TGME49_227030 [Toxoplasma gondii ME49]